VPPEVVLLEETKPVTVTGGSALLTPFGNGAEGARLALLSCRILVRRHFNFIHNFFDIWCGRGQLLRFALLRLGLDAPLQYQRFLLGIVGDASVVKVLMRLQGRFDVVFDTVIRTGIDGFRLVLESNRTHSWFVGDGYPGAACEAIVSACDFWSVDSTWPASVTTLFWRSCATVTTPRLLRVMAVLTASLRQDVRSLGCLPRARKSA
jgi:hypothetical protein